MKGILGLALFIAGAGTVAVDDTAQGESVSPDALAVLKKSDVALKAVKTASYTAAFRGTNWIASRVPSVEGVATIGKRSEWDIDPFSCEVKIKQNDSEETLAFTAGSNGDSFFLIDGKTKTVYEDIDPLVLGAQGRNIQRVLAREFAMPEPYADAYKTESITMKDKVTIDGDTCHVVQVEGKEPPVVTYYIATTDSLPRRIVRTYKNGEGEEGTTELTISHLKVNPSFSRDPFSVIVPKGFKKTDEFAP